MSQEPTTGIEDAVQRLELKDQPSQHISVSATDSEANPWRDDTPPSTTSTAREPPPIPSSDDTDGFGTFAEAKPALSSVDKTVVDTDVLHEFDPLAEREQDEVREAWAHSESHPPPPPVPSKPITPEPPAKVIPVPSSSGSQPQTPISSSPSLGGFPTSLASLARSFSLGGRSRQQRPHSIDSAAAVPSPATLSSFAAQQRQAPLPPPLPPRDTVIEQLPAPSDQEPRGNGSERATEQPKDETVGKDQAFDFQKFLDQMKLKGAESVAKYLRSCVNPFAY
jgi:Rab5 GDP/GTP exchange factor